MEYCLKIPGIVYAGTDSLKKLSSVLKENKVTRAAVLTDAGIVKSGITKRPIEDITNAVGQVAVFDRLAAEPTADQVQAVVDECREFGADFIVAIGGGSVLDTAKLVSVLPPGLTVRDLLEDSSKAVKQMKTLMIPTTAGTGAEATPNAIVAVPEKELKVGIVNEAMVADYVILDVSMVEKLPPKIAASTGLDALAHAIECFTSKKANPISDTFALRALEMIMMNLEAACGEPADLHAREQILLASFYAGVAITASGTTAVHALSYPLGGKYHIPHGVSNAIMLAPVMRFNEPDCRELLAAAYDRIADDGAAMTEEEKSGNLIKKLCRMVEVLEIPASLSVYGVSRDDLDVLVDAGMQVQRLLVNNRRTVTEEDARKLYLEVL